MWWCCCPVVACVCGDGIVDVDGCGGGSEGSSSMSIPVLTSRSSIFWIEGGGLKDVDSSSKFTSIDISGL